MQNEKKMLTILKFNEWLWLFFVIVSVGCSIYMLAVGDRSQALYFLILIFLSGFFYSFKKRQRKRHEKRIFEAEEKQK
ncbi:MAG: hypothetical protein K0S33_1350 [Bacteroidetes bacterium]|nr:hypothetical protein [Bacteroidota bacterium]